MPCVKIGALCGDGSMLPKAAEPPKLPRSPVTMPFCQPWHMEVALYPPAEGRAVLGVVQHR